MSWDEWEQLKSAAAERTTHMQLNQYPSDAAGSGTLVSDRPVWTKAGQEVGAFREDIAKALGHLSDGQDGLGTDAGCLTAGAQKEVHDSWARYVKDVGGRCGKLAALLGKAGGDLSQTDDGVLVDIQNLRTAYADTPAVGGKG
ncbi:hypothetical protein DF268_42695 [Streptomyces sp. V2]|uniref:hypothetical protein n=1 Tax=Streptomyces TaxID=1883 RepID=UPI0006EB2991|nr:MULTISPECIES: hypothetical protein [Streptomyces]PWG07538.1 hypothetical protein DF268_42695 [Streptomyces sp. V2]QZZ29662.1 hypothetical protein A7X85_28520 [Streptomyces sp. ST1015]